MATGNDVREIFQLKPSDQIKRVHKVEKKPDGISRELYGLIGNNVSTVAFNNPTYKPKLNLSSKAVNWSWRPFVNPSREDDLVLHHWEKTRTDPNEEYRFYKFNKVIDLKEFTPEEYRAHLQDPDWTLEETGYLWDLCRRFDLRWVVIQDRYEWPPQEQDWMALHSHPKVSPKPPLLPSIQQPTSSSSSAAPTSSTDALSEFVKEPSSNTNSITTSTGNAPSSLPTSMDIVRHMPSRTRTMEDLKNRYYTINRALIKARMSDSSQAVEKAQLLSSMAYDKDRETERKRNLEILNTRTPEQIEEEEALYLEARRIDQNEKKITKERENLLRLLNTRDIYGPGGPVSAGLTANGSLVAGSGGPGTGIIIPSNSITIPSSGPSNGGPMSPSVKNANGVAAAAQGANGAPVKKRKKAPKGSVQAEEAVAAAAASASAAVKGSSSSHNRRPSNASVNDASLSSPMPSNVQFKKEKLTPGAYLRSQKMTPVVSTKQQRVQATLTQLGIPLKPAMPTATVMAKWDQLSNNIVTLLDLKKQVDKLETDLKVVKARRGSNSGLGSFSSAVATAAGASGVGGGTGLSLVGGGDGNYGVKREGTADESGTPGQVKKKKRKE